MIKISPKNLDSVIDEYYNKIFKYINQYNTKYNLDDLNCDLLHCFDKDFEQIVKITPREQFMLINNMPESFLEDIRILQDLYEVFRNKWAVWLMEALNIKVCPYCNREYIFKFEDGIQNKDRTIATFDHYYTKSKYPFLAVSFYNLIPSCHICNSKFKHKYDFFIHQHLHPYEDDFNAKAKFNLKIKDSTFFYDEDGFDIEIINIENDTKTKNNIKTFRLNDVYQNHKDIVLELIKKREIYPDSYIEELSQNYSSLFKNSEDLLRLIAGAYIEDKDIGKRPLNKLIKDISEELELI